MISIAMTSYNGEKYVLEQLESLKNQSIKPDEVIIVDDCSTDSTPLIIQNFINENKLMNWNLVLLKENIGYKKAFLTAIKETKGEVIFLCDHDDIWMDNKIEIMYDCMKKNPEILVLNSSFIKIDSVGKRINSRNNFFSSNNNLIRKKIRKEACVNIDIETLVAYNISPGCTLAFRADLIKILNNFESDKYDLVHDWKINIIAAGKNGLYYLNTPTILYRLHNNNTIGLQKKITIDARIAEYKKVLIERKFLARIIEYQCKDHKLFPNINNSILDRTIDINNSIEERIEILREANLKRYFTLPFKCKVLRSRMIESWLFDIYILLKSKFF